MARHPRSSGAGSTMDPGDLSPRQAFREAVWASPDLRPDEKFVALAYAQFAHHGLEVVWLTRTTLKAKTNLSSTRAHRAVRSLEGKDWLVKLPDGGTGTRAQRYRLVIPSSDPDAGSLSDPDAGSQEPSSDPVSASSDPVSASSDPAPGRDLYDLRDLPPRQARKLPELLTILAGEGIGEDDIPAILAISTELGADYPVGRLCNYEPHRVEVIGKWRDEAAEARRQERENAPACWACDRPIDECDAELDSRIAPVYRCRRHDEQRAAAS